MDSSKCDHPVKDEIAIRIHGSVIGFLNTKLGYGMQCDLLNVQPTDPLLSITVKKRIG
jgi:hypothetical protein